MSNRALMVSKHNKAVWYVTNFAAAENPAPEVVAGTARLVVSALGNCPRIMVTMHLEGMRFYLNDYRLVQL